MAETSKMDRNLALEAVRVTEVAALSASRLMGRGDEKAADQAAVDAMRQALNSLAIDGTVVIGEGERDEAPMLYIGEKVGTGHGPKIDIALDPLEGTTITAKGGANALAVLAMADAGGFLNAPDVYMDKIAVGGGLPDDLVDLDETPAANLKNLAQAKKASSIADLVVCILDRPRHAELIAKVRAAGARIMLIGDGDVSGVIATSEPGDRHRHLYGLGRRAGRRAGGGGAALHRRADAGPAAVPQRRRARPRPSPRHHRSRTANTSCSTSRGRCDVRRDRRHQRHDAERRAPLPRRRLTHSVVMRSKTGTVRYVEAQHDFTRKEQISPASPIARSRADPMDRWARRRIGRESGRVGGRTTRGFLGVERSVCGRRWRVAAAATCGAAAAIAERLAAARDRRAAAGAARRRPRRGAAVSSRRACATSCPIPSHLRDMDRAVERLVARDPRRRDDRRLRRLRCRRRDLGGAAAAVLRGGRRRRSGSTCPTGCARATARTAPALLG